jgi:hypothetical protein
MFVDHVYESDGIEIGVRYYPTDGARVMVNRLQGDEWREVYDMRVIADNLWETIYTGLCGAGLEDEDAIAFLDWHGVEYPTDEED